MKGLASMAVAAFLVASGAAAAQDDGFAGKGSAPAALAGEGQDTYGTSSLTVYSVVSLNFVGRQSATAYSTSGGVDRFSTTAGGVLQASPNLPNGSQIERIELRACDNSATEEVLLQMGPCPTGGTSCTLGGAVATGLAATPGCSNFPFTLVTPIVVNNQTTPILLSVSTGTTSVTSFSAVKLYYRLQVSPAPAVATFPMDVPTSHPIFRFVEALAAAGITGGCGAGTYCPDAPLTRGQMAVFLATALGLHFPN
jgi:S-layer family protein